jgi:hypothetical protein
MSDPAHPRAIDQAATLLLTTNKDGSAANGPPVLRAVLVKVALALGQRGVELPAGVATVVGELAAEAGVMEGQPPSQMHARVELHLEQAIPPPLAALIERAFREASAHGPTPILRFAAVVHELVSAGGSERKRDAAGTPAGPLARALLAREKS